MDSIYTNLERLFLAMSDQTRMRLLTYMAGGEVSVGYLADAVGQSQPKVSRHLAYLRNMGLVSTRRDGKWIYYAVDRDMPEDVRRVLTETLAVLGRNQVSFATTPVSRSDGPNAHDAETQDMYQDVYIDHLDTTDDNDWQPTELDVFLL